MSESLNYVVSNITLYPIKSCAGISCKTAQIAKFGFENDRRWMLVDAESGRMMTARRLNNMMSIKPKFSEDGEILIISAPDSLDLQIPIVPTKKLNSIQVSVWNSTVSALDEGDEVAQWFSKYLNFQLRLVRYDDERHDRSVNDQFKRKDKEEFVSFADDFPFMLLSEESIDDLNSRSSTYFPMARFRPNITVKCSQTVNPWYEDQWKGSIIKIGDIEFRVCSDCVRCKMITIDPETCKMGEEPTKILSTFRQGLVSGGKEISVGQNLVCQSSTGSISVGQFITISH